jgi:hypothetical protein
LGNGEENLKLSNNIELREVTGNICTIIDEGAKYHKEDATLVTWLSGDEKGEPQMRY